MKAPYLVIGIVTVTWLGCSPDPGGTDTTDGGTDGDMDGDVDGDVDGDGDGDADADSDADSDIDGDSDGPTDSDLDEPSDADEDEDADEDDADTPASRIASIVEMLDDPGSDRDDIESVLYEVAWDEGWPLEDRGRWLFVAIWEDAPEMVSLVGQLNEWSTSAHPATRSPAGPFFYVVLDGTELTTAAAGSKYKWWGSPDTWRPPYESRAYGYDEHGRFGWVRPSPTEPHLELYPSMMSDHLDLPRSIRAYLPAGFEPGSASARSARVLLLHDGQNVFHPDAPWGGWHVNDALLDGGYDDVVAIGVDSIEDRMDVYSHVPDDIFGDGTMVGGRADAYLRMLREEVLPFIRDHYGIEAASDSLMVSGSSMGGLITLYMVLTDPDGLACGAALSPSLFWGAVGPTSSGEDAIVSQWSTVVGHGTTAIYLDSGGGPGGGCVDSDDDGVEDDGDGADNYCVTVQMRDALEALGYSHGVDLWHWWERDALHNEAAWAVRFPMVLEACETGGWIAL